MIAPVVEDVATAHGRFGLLRARRPGAPLLLLLHGFPDHPPTFEPLIERLAGAGYDVAAPWMRGYAPSPRTGPYHLEQLGTDALAIAAALAGDRPAYIVGHDWGALATYAACALAPGRFRGAVTMAVPHPLAVARSLVTTAQLARSWYILAFNTPGAERWARARDFAFVDRLWRTWSPGLTLGGEEQAALHRCLAESWPAPLAPYRALMRPLGEAIRRAGPRSPLSRPIATPTLNLQGARDGCIAPSAARGQARFFAGPFASEVIADVGHFLHVEDPATVAGHIEAWFARVADGALAAAAHAGGGPA